MCGCCSARHLLHKGRFRTHLQEPTQLDVDERAVILAADVTRPELGQRVDLARVAQHVSHTPRDGSGSVIFGSWPFREHSIRHERCTRVASLPSRVGDGQEQGAVLSTARRMVCQVRKPCTEEEPIRGARSRAVDPQRDRPRQFRVDLGTPTAPVVQALGLECRQEHASEGSPVDHDPIISRRQVGRLPRPFSPFHRRRRAPSAA